jgi:hypothetical protein
VEADIDVHSRLRVVCSRRGSLRSAPAKRNEPTVRFLCRKLKLLHVQALVPEVIVVRGRLAVSHSVLVAKHSPGDNSALAVYQRKTILDRVHVRVSRTWRALCCGICGAFAPTHMVWPPARERAILVQRNERAQVREDFGDVAQTLGRCVAALATLAKGARSPIYVERRVGIPGGVNGDVTLLVRNGRSGKRN